MLFFFKKSDVVFTEFLCCYFQKLRYRFQDLEIVFQELRARFHCVAVAIFQGFICDLSVSAVAIVFQEVIYDFQTVAVVFQKLRCRFQSVAVMLFFKNVDVVFTVLLCCCFSKTQISF
jgi:hypothetical protein